MSWDSNYFSTFLQIENSVFLWYANTTNLRKFVNFLLHRLAGDTMPLRTNQLK